MWNISNSYKSLELETESNIMRIAQGNKKSGDIFERKYR